MKQPIVKQARALSSSVIYLSWEGPIDHPGGGFNYCIYLKTGSSPLTCHKELPPSDFDYSLRGLQGNVRYTLCVGVVDKLSKTKNECRKVVIVTTPAQKGKSVQHLNLCNVSLASPSNLGPIIWNKLGMLGEIMMTVSVFFFASWMWTVNTQLLMKIINIHRIFNN